MCSLVLRMCVNKTRPKRQRVGGRGKRGGEDQRQPASWEHRRRTPEMAQRPLTPREIPWYYLITLRDWARRDVVGSQLA